MITGFILAGGRSIRMGTEKAWLPVGAQSMVETLLQRIRPHVDRVKIVANALNRRSFKDLNVDAVLTDLAPGQGPLMGIYTGLMSSETEWNLFLSCDMPWVAAELLERLLSASRGPSQVAACLQPGAGMQPFPMACRLSAARVAGVLLNRQERSLHRFLEASRAQSVTIEEPRLWSSFMNINTPQDYAELREKHT